MPSVENLLQKPSGVYWLDHHTSLSELEKSAKLNGCAFFHIEGKKLEKKEQFLSHAALTLHFPNYFGNNWDAFEECLTDLSWIDANNYLIIYDHTDVLLAHSAKHFDTLLEILTEATEFWRSQGKHMWILLQGKQKIQRLETLD